MNAMQPRFSDILRRELVEQQAARSFHVERGDFFADEMRKHSAAASSAGHRCRALEAALLQYADEPVEAHEELPATATEIETTTKEEPHVDGRSLGDHPSIRTAGPSSSTVEAEGTGETARASTRTEKISPAEAIIGSAVKAGATTSKKDCILKIWSESGGSHSTIAKACGATTNSVAVTIAKAKNAGDPRGTRGAVKSTSAVAHVPGPTPDEKLEAFADVSRPASDPDLSRIRHAKVDLVGRDGKGEFISLDIDNLIVSGPHGDRGAPRSDINVLARMISGGLFGDKTLAEAGALPVSRFNERVPMIRAYLAEIGIDLLETRGIGFLIRRAAK